LIIRAGSPVGRREAAGTAKQAKFRPGRAGPLPPQQHAAKPLRWRASGKRQGASADTNRYLMAVAGPRPAGPGAPRAHVLGGAPGAALGQRTPLSIVRRRGAGV